MNPTLAQLQTLKRQAGTRTYSPMLPTPGPTSSRRTPVNVQQLRQLLRLRDPGVARPAIVAEGRTLPGDEIAPGLRLVEARLPAPAVPPTIAGGFDRRDDIDTDRVLFFDTETTGLAGGTGTRAFMLGAAVWENQTLHIRQLLITRLAAEAAMLTEFARWLHTDTILASYNGKSYDAPLLRNRYRLARMDNPMVGLAHIDLLYPARRRYRGVYENCRLDTNEREVLKIIRDDDLPGSEAPAAWIAYLRGRSSANLCRVLAHNRQDVASLARLLLHLGA
jgi:uncharacterized protein YprB with RNaseH-like and TPR domain